MNYSSVEEIALKWRISGRSVRNYCAQGRIEGAKLIGKKWLIPENAKKPIRKNTKDNLILKRLKEEKESKISGGIYHKIQIDLTYNSNHIEGSRLSKEQTLYIFETNTIGLQKEPASIDDIVETKNHFRCIDLVIDNANSKLSEKLIKELHKILKTGTSDAEKEWFAVGDYKRVANAIGDYEPTSPGKTPIEMKSLFNSYNKTKNSLDDILNFHVQFERIHPFQDGNGRVGRLIMFKECLKNNIIPFIIYDDLKYFYYRGLKEWNKDKAYLRDTCLTAQDRFKEYLDYFEIKY